MKHCGVLHITSCIKDNINSTLRLTACRHYFSFTNLEFQIENQNLTFELLETIWESTSLFLISISNV